MERYTNRRPLIPGIGKVELARDLISGETVVLKNMNETNFRREVRVFKVIKGCPYILYPLQILEESQNLVFEKFGQDLFMYLRPRKDIINRLKEKDAKRVFAQIALTIKYIHDRGIAHLDLKPENILIDDDLNVKLIDWDVSIHESTVQRKLGGTTEYLSPECFGDYWYTYTKERDIWAFGVTIFDVVIGDLPFRKFKDLNCQKLARKGIFRDPKGASEELIDLFREVFNPDPRKRIQIDELLEHPWLRQSVQDYQFVPIQTPRIELACSLEDSEEEEIPEVLRKPSLDSFCSSDWSSSRDSASPSRTISLTCNEVDYRSNSD